MRPQDKTTYSGLPSALVNGIRYLTHRSLGDFAAEFVVERICLKISQSIHGDFAEQRRDILAIVKDHINQWKQGSQATEPPTPMDEPAMSAAADLLRKLPARKRLALVMYYCDRVPEETVCQQSAMTSSQFTTLKQKARQLIAKHSDAQIAS